MIYYNDKQKTLTSIIRFKLLNKEYIVNFVLQENKINNVFFIQ